MEIFSGLSSPWQKIGDIFSLSMLFLCALFIPFSTAGLEIANYLALLGFLIGGNYLSKFRFIQRSPFILSALVFYLIMLLCCLYSPAGKDAILGSIRAYEKLFLIPVGLWAFHLYPKTIRYFFAVIVTALLMNFILGFFKFYNFWPISQTTLQGYHSASFGSLKGSGHIALSYFASMLTFGLGALFIHQFRKLSTLARWMTGIGTLLSLYYLLMVTDGRSGLVTFCVLVMYGVFRTIWSFKSYKAALVVLLLTGLAASLSLHYSPVLKQRLSAGTSDLQQYQQGHEDTSWGERLNFWKNSLKLIEHKPFWGYGTGSMKQEYSSIDKRNVTDNPHNQYLFLWVEEGVPGVLSFLALLYFASKKPTSLRGDRAPLPISRILLEGSVLAFAVGCLYNSWLHDVHEGFFILMVWIGLYARTSQK